MPVLDRIPRIATLALTGVRRAGSIGLDAARDLVEGAQRRRQAHSPPQTAQAEPPSANPMEPSPADAAQPAPAPVAAAEPDHVDREAVVVAESHDPGAEDGVGAQITVDEPWDGYDELTVEQVLARLEDASAETLAVVRLYERMHRDRRGIGDGIDRRLAALAD